MTEYRKALLSAYGQLTALLKEGEPNEQNERAIQDTFLMLEVSVAKARKVVDEFTWRRTF